MERTFLLAIGFIILAGCTSESLQTHSNVNFISQSAVGEKPVTEPSKQKAIPSKKSPVAVHKVIYPPFSLLLPGYTFIKHPSHLATEVSFWITYEPYSDFHVPWHLGGDSFNPYSEKIVIDPVKKTIGLDFDPAKQNDWSCLKDGSQADRDIQGYSICNSQFAQFPVARPKPQVKPRTLWERLFDKPKVVVFSNKVDVELAQRHIGLVAEQLNLASRAVDQLKGTPETPKQKKERMLKDLTQAQSRFESQLALLQNKVISEYDRAAKKRKKIIHRKIIDKSGFYNYDIKWVDSITIRPRKIPKKYFNYSSFIREFNRQEITDASHTILNLLISRMRQKFDQDRTSLLSYLKKMTADYSLTCRYPKKYGNYLISAKCPDRISLTNGVFDIPITFEIFEKKFGTTLPAYNSFNTDLSVQADNHRLKFQNNLPDTSLSIDRVEWLANNLVSPLKRKGYFPIKLKPGESKSIPLKPFLNKPLLKALNVSWISRRKALNKTFFYGFNIYYHQLRKSDSSAHHLDQKSRYNLSDLLMSKF